MNLNVWGRTRLWPALSAETSGGRSVGIVRSWTKGHGGVFLYENNPETKPVQPVVCSKEHGS
jgi:hypothetical protein